MSEDVERVADAIESARLPSGGTILASRVQIEVLARAAIAAMTPTPQVVEAVGELKLGMIVRDKMGQVGEVITRQGSYALRYTDGNWGYGLSPGVFPATVLYPHPTPDVDVIAEVRALHFHKDDDLLSTCWSESGVCAECLISWPCSTIAILDRKATQ